MSASTFKILRQCLMCGSMFEAQKVSTQYCSHKCNSKHYKLKRKLDKKEIAEQELATPSKAFRPKLPAINKAIIKDNEFLTVNQVAVLFNCTAKAVYGFIKAGVLPAIKLSERKTLVKRSKIDKLFE